MANQFLKLSTVLVLGLCCSGADAKEKVIEKVVLVDKIPTTASYTWWVDGKGSISCTASTCSSYFMPAESGAGSVQGAILRLKRKDGTIAIAKCVAKERIGADVVTAMAGVTASPTYRDCRIPELGGATEIDAEFHLNTVKLYFQNPSTDNSGRISSETYLVFGTLHPVPLPGVASGSGFEREQGSRDAACGPEKTLVKVHIEKKEHPMADPDAAHALIYIIQEDEFHVIMMGTFPTKYGLDGQWIGGNGNTSYFYTSVDPGEHHLCAEWGINFKHYVTPLSLAKIQLQSGESYFFRARVVFFSVSGAGERSITLEPMDADEGKRLVAIYAFSTAKIK